MGPTYLKYESLKKKIPLFWMGYSKKFDLKCFGPTIRFIQKKYYNRFHVFYTRSIL